MQIPYGDVLLNDSSPYHKAHTFVRWVG
eukprot:SAG31_NODE_29591_length_392_cov_3.290102_1_plen_27_part_10